MPQVIPRDDRVFLRWAGPLSKVIVLATIGTGLALEAGAPDTTSRALTAVGFVAEFLLMLAVYAAGSRRWLAGHPFPGGLQATGLAGVGLAVAVLVLYEDRVGGTMLVGSLGGLFAANLATIRAARRNRARVDEIEALIALESELVGGPGASTGVVTLPMPVEPDTVEPASNLPVGQVLRAKLATDRRRALAWSVAAGLAAPTCLQLGLDAATFGVVFMSLAAVLWVLRRLWGGWLALHDFEAAGTQPRRAYVVMLPRQPNAWRPLLGVWSQPPFARDGHMPPPEQVYLCDDDHDALTTSTEFVVPYEAWVDTGPHRFAKPRWIVADGGIALPHRKALLARLYMKGQLRPQRPEGIVPLTIPRPQPGPTDGDVGTLRPGFLVLVAGRLAVLAFVVLVFEWAF